MTTEFDVVIVGSGFGGAVAACRLAEADRRVLVLERGRRWTPEQYPSETGRSWRYNRYRPHRRNGWADVRFLDGDMVVVSGAGVGGGSLIYANVSIDARPDVFESGWPTEIDADVLKPYYAKVGAMLDPKPVPHNQTPLRLHMLANAAAAIGASDRVERLDLAVRFDPEWSADRDEPTDRKHSVSQRNAYGHEQGTCTHCGKCDLGCPVRAKNTLDLNYLAAAENSGNATIRPLCQVSHVSQTPEGWRVHYDDVSSGRRVSATVDARRVILAAGSIGSTEILMTSKFGRKTLPNLPPALGKGWSSNGDYLTPAWYPNKTLAPTVGPTITSAIDFLDGTSEFGGRFFIEDGGLPNLFEVITHSRGRSFVGRRLHRMAALDRIMPWFGQAIDASDGDFYLGRHRFLPWRRDLRLDWNPVRSTSAIDAMSAMHRKLSEETGGHPLPRLMWKWFRGLVTPHPLGGCSMAAAPGAGVVDHAGRVFGHPGLYVMDGAIIPRAIGRNPSKTIAAVAERAVALLLEEEARHFYSGIE